jgi:cell wall-associated NlpC family hydrolase
MRLPVAAGLLILASTTVGCASTGAVPEPFPTPGAKARRIPAPPPSAVATTGRTLPSDGYAIVGTALDLRGRPYRDGGADPSGFDCSGFVEYVFGQHGVAVPRTVLDLYRSGRDVSPSDLQPGDLVFFSTTAAGPTHVGMAIGGDEFVHAPSSAGVVRVERLSGRYRAPRFIGAKRVL